LKATGTSGKKVSSWSFSPEVGEGGFWFREREGETTLAFRRSEDRV